MRLSLSAKLIVAFALVVMVALGVVYWAANRATVTELRHFMFRGAMVEAGDMADALARYYASNGSWQGLSAALVGTGGMMGHGPGGMMGMEMPGMMGMGMPGMMSSSLIVADANGRVVADTAGRRVGGRLSDGELAEGVPITVDGRRVGTLIVEGGMTATFGPLERNFLSRVNRAVLLAGLAAGLMALLLAGLIVRQVTAPVRALTRAAEHIAGGDLRQRVQVSSDDEIGDLARSFNRMAESLERAEALRRDMVADIAHELRTPLSVIQGNLEALLDGVFPLNRESLASVHQETLLLARLVEDLRELALADAGQLRLDLQPTDMADLVARTVQAFQAQAAEKDVRLEVHLAPDLPRVTADPRRIEQVLRNLLSNALRHTPAKGTIRVEARGLEQRWELRGTSGGFGELQAHGFSRVPALLVSVTDSGPGIPPEDRERVFERFWRADKSRSRAEGGAGLGLAIARKLVEAHGGHIWATSGPDGRGATFAFVLPVAGAESGQVDSGAG